MTAASPTSPVRQRLPVASPGARRVVLVANPISGRGRADRMAAEAAGMLRSRGHRAERIPTRLEPTAEWLDPAIRGADAMIVVGGDGAVRMVADAAIRTGVPLHHLPLGTENLFAREFRSTRRPEDLLAAVERGTVVRVDAAAFEGGALDGRLFLLMASIGFDADVVHDLSARRRGAITHLSYVAPILRRAFRWRGPELEVRVDGEPLVQGVRGTLVISNCRQYGGRLDPSPEASMTDGRLDVVVLPARTALGMARRAVGCRLRWGGVPRGRGREIEVRCRPASRVQIDGDTAGPVDQRLQDIRCVVRPAALPVLAPPLPVR